MVDEPGGDYWRRIQEFVKEVLLKRQLISPGDLALFKVTDKVSEAVAEVLDFYKTYHSMRYVERDLVLRLKKPVSTPLLERMRRDFKDIVVSGTIEQVAALPAESNETHLADMPRLRFHFDRRNLGRLRMLVDTINREG
jgi:hypothetical protein